MSSFSCDAGPMPSFVVLSHTFSKAQSGQNHLDLMIEYDGQLLTWRIMQWPPSTETQVAIQLPPHRLAYLEYEGPVSGNRGTVRRVARGSCQIVRLDNSNLEVQIHSDNASGVLKIYCDNRVNESTRETSDSWRLWMEPEDAASSHHGN